MHSKRISAKEPINENSNFILHRQSPKPIILHNNNITNNANTTYSNSDSLHDDEKKEDNVIVSNPRCYPNPNPTPNPINKLSLIENKDTSNDFKILEKSSSKSKDEDSVGNNNIREEVGGSRKGESGSRESEGVSREGVEVIGEGESVWIELEELSALCLELDEEEDE